MAKSELNFNKEGATEILKYLLNETNDIKDIFDEVEFMTEAINGEDETWQGQSQDSFYDSFKSISGKFGEIGENLDRHNDFLAQTINGYEERENEINNNADQKAEELNIN